MTILNEIIHQPVRLRIMAILAPLQPTVQVTFTYLKNILGLTDGNLGAHLHKLEDAGYVVITKTFVLNKPQTYVASTEDGRNAFEEHTKALREILESGREIGQKGALDADEISKQPSTEMSWPLDQNSGSQRPGSLIERTRALALGFLAQMAKA